MKNQQTYSHGLLYSVTPDNLSSLHLIDEDKKKDTFDWEAYAADYNGESFVTFLLNFLKITAISWGLIKLH